MIRRMAWWAAGVVAAVGLGIYFAAPSIARDEERMRWRGRVDGKVEIYVRQKQVRLDLRNGRPVEDMKYDFSRGLPQRNVRVYLENRDGRGRIEVFQQPNSGNDYTAGVRIDDPEPGSDRYRFDLAWNDSGGGSGGSGGNWSGDGSYNSEERTAIRKSQENIRFWIQTNRPNRPNSRDIRFGNRPFVEFRGSNTYRVQGEGTYNPNARRFRYQANVNVKQGTTSGMNVQDY